MLPKLCDTTSAKILPKKPTCDETRSHDRFHNSFRSFARHLQISGGSLVERSACLLISGS